MHGRKCKRREVQYTAHLSQQKPTRITKTPICSHNPHARTRPCSHKPQNQTKSHGGQSAHHHRPPIQTPSISSLNSCSIATHLCICHLVHCINIPGPFFLTKHCPGVKEMKGWSIMPADWCHVRVSMPQKMMKWPVGQ